VIYDVREIANAVLEIAHRERNDVSNLSLNKIIYFLHAGFLHEYNRPLVSAKIEAWDHGPVFREVYHQFKEFGRNSINRRARKLDPTTGMFIEVKPNLDDVTKNFIEKHSKELLNLSPAKLVDMSHVRDGPWYAARFGNGRLNPGVEITDELIRASAKTQVRH